MILMASCQAHVPGGVMSATTTCADLLMLLRV